MVAAFFVTVADDLEEHCSAGGIELFPFKLVIGDEKVLYFEEQLFWEFVQGLNLLMAARVHRYRDETIIALLRAVFFLLFGLDHPDQTWLLPPHKSRCIHQN